ncbi:MAG: hypothetical protein ACLTCI_11115 [[Clostridium] nexile]
MGIPIILTVLHLAAVTISLNDPKRKNIGGKMLSVVFWIVPIVSWVMFLSIYTNALNMSINISVSGVWSVRFFLLRKLYV